MRPDGRFSVLLMLVLAFFGTETEAQFVKIGRHSYGDVSRHAFAVSVSGDHGERGVFAAASQEQLPLEQFHPSLSGLSSIFITLDEKTRLFTKLTLADGSSFQIAGNFSIELAEGVHLAVDLRFNPYLSLIVDRKDGTPSILAFMGAIEPLLNLGGREAVDYLRANAIPPEYQSAIHEFRIGGDGSLFSDNAAITAKTIGLGLDRQQNCLLQGVPLLNSYQLNQIRAMKDQQSARDLLKTILKGYEKNNPLDGVVFLGVRPNALSVFYPKNNDYLLIEEEWNRYGGMKVCKVTPLTFAARQ